MSLPGRVAILTAGLLALPVGLLASTAGHGAAAMFDSGALAGEIPQPMLDAYLDAADRWDIGWALLAAVGKIECDHGRFPAPGCNPPGTVNHAGARGPMQFLGSTWRASAGRYDLDVAGPPTDDERGYATDGDGNGIADPWNTYDAVHSAARFLVDLGGRDDPRRAAKGYNAGPANPDPTAGESYATRVAALIAHYHKLAGPGGPGDPTPMIVGRFALPFDRDGLHAATTAAIPARDPEWQLVKPHHSGRVATDIPLPAGTALYALTDATVAFAGAASKCGHTVILDTDGAQITYCHLTKITVRHGQAVQAGTYLGTSGGVPGTAGAGNSTGPHLHLHITTPRGRRCPQALLLALWRSWPPPPIRALRTNGCTYQYVPPPPRHPVPIPPDLPLPEPSA